MSHVPIDPLFPGPARHGLPRAGIDPIDSAPIAERFVRRLLGQPRRHETIAILLDHARCGFAIVTVDGTTDPDAVFAVAENLIEVSIDAPVSRVLLVSVRPGTDDPVDRLDDFDRWLELDETFQLTGIELVEWFVFDDRGLTLPRALLGEPPRWCRG